MTICFVLPKFTRQPIGGYKIIFEYANRLKQEGYTISILFLNESFLVQFKFPRFIKNMIANYLTHIGPKWFPLNKDIIKVSSLQKNYMKLLEDSDIVFATGIQTVELVKSRFKNSKKLYLIQGYENWGVTDEYLWSTYNFGFKNIAVSSWLKEIVDKHSNQVTEILKNPIDINIYKEKIKQKDRKNYTIGLLYHTEEIKGVRYALETIYKLKEKYPELTVQMFGMFPTPIGLPKWIHYKRGASQKETVDIYNMVQVFLCASIEEGYGLTGLEAMACGACLVSTAYKGVLEYAKDGYNSLLSPIKDVNALVKNVSKLLENIEERDRISKNGIASVKEYSWDEAINQLKSYL